MPSQLVAFLIVCGVVTITPGPDMALALRNAMRGGANAAWRTGLGCCAGIAVHATIAVIGLSAILAASATAFMVVKLAGAAYLIYLGASALWRARRGTSTEQHDHRALAATGADGARAFRQGLISNLLNPKIALFFLTLIPQFVSPGEATFSTTAILAVAFLSFQVVWWRLFSLAAARVSRELSRPRVRVAVERVTGAVLVTLGFRVALDSR